MFEAFVNMFRIPELRKKILFTLGILIVYRLGCLLPCPGVNIEGLAAMMGQGGALSQVFGVVSMLSGGALSKATIFALGIMPYISATIIFQLLTGVIPTLEKLRKEGEPGLKKIRQYERYTTVAICFVQAILMIRFLQAGKDPTTHDPLFIGNNFVAMVDIIAMTAGTMLMMWLGDQITQHGVGNGISLIIMAGIIDRLPIAIYDAIRNTGTGNLTPGTLIFLVVAFVVVVGGVVIMTQGQRRIPVQQAKMTRGRRVFGGQRQYLPFRVNHSGVMPVIFASTLLIFPTLICQAMSGVTMFGGQPFLWMHEHLFVRGSSWVYVTLYILLIYFFSYFWTSIMFKPKDLSENLQDYGSFIPGIRPGPRTAEYLENVMTHITLAGSTFLAAVAIFPQVLQSVLNVGWQMAGFYGGTSLLIVVGVALDLVEKIESHLMMRHYEGFMRKGKIRGRR